LEAAHHVCNDISLFNADFTRQNWAELRRVVPDGYRVEGSGTVEVILEFEGEIASLYLDEVIYVPTSQHNKISGQRVKEGFQVETDGILKLSTTENTTSDADANADADADADIDDDVDDEHGIRPIDLVTERYAAPGKVSSPIDWTPVDTWKWFTAPASTKPGLRTLILQLRQEVTATNA
jgi:hypothetical protein